MCCLKKKKNDTNEGDTATSNLHLPGHTPLPDCRGNFLCSPTEQYTVNAGISALREKSYIMCVYKMCKNLPYVQYLRVFDRQSL